jgi:hypothetical protein
MPSFTVRLSLITATAVLLAGAWAVAAPSSSEEQLQLHATKARQFLCRKSLCLKGDENDVPARADNDTHGYLAYFHRDKRRISLTRGLDSIATQLNLVHELTHAYRDQFNHEEETWLDEGLAKFMEYQYSRVWPVSYQERLKKNPEIRLRNDEGDYKNGPGYVSAFYLVLYLYNHFGGEALLKKLLESNVTGWSNILSSIGEIKKEGRTAIDASIISKASILRHFALALWLNDPYAAKYGLFAIDSQYEAIPHPTASSLDLATTQLNREAGEARLVFSDKFVPNNAAEVYAITSRNPLKIERPQDTKSAEVYIYIFH